MGPAEQVGMLFRCQLINAYPQGVKFYLRYPLIYFLGNQVDFIF